MLKVLVSTLKLNILEFRERAVAVRTWKSHGLPIERDFQVFHSIQAKSVIFDRRPPQWGNCTLTLENRKK